MDATATSSPAPKAGDDRPITLSAVAVGRVRTLVAEQKLEGYYLRVGVVPGGCSGFQYDLDLVREPRPGDLTFEQDGLRLATDPLGADVLRGTVIDFVDDGMRAGFAFRNPNAQHTCGCGSSFQT